MRRTRRLLGFACFIVLMFGFFYLTRYLIYADWYLIGEATVPSMRDKWRVDSHTLSNLTISSEIDFGEQVLKSECMRTVTFRGKIALDEKTWKVHPAKKDLWATKKKIEDTNGLPLGWVRVDVLRRRRFEPGFKSVMKGLGRIPKKNGTCYFDFDVVLPNVPGEYLLVANLVATEDSQKKDYSEIDKKGNVLFVRKIQVVPFVRRENEKTQKFRSGA